MTDLSPGVAEMFAEVLCDEQVSLWYDLDAAIRDAYNDTWSLRCADVAIRIARIARLIGPTPARSAPTRLVGGGVYAALLDVAKIEYVSPPNTVWADLGERAVARDSHLTTIARELAATVAAMRADSMFTAEAAPPRH